DAGAFVQVLQRAASIIGHSFAARDTQPTAGQLSQKPLPSALQRTTDSPRYGRPRQRASARQDFSSGCAPQGSADGAVHQSEGLRPQAGPIGLICGVSAAPGTAAASATTSAIAAKRFPCHG